MAGYKVDRALLESYSTEEILRVLREEKDDYTPEAIKVFHRILEARGVSGNASSEVHHAQAPGPVASEANPGRDVLIRSPGDAVGILNGLLSGVLSGTVDPERAQVALNLVMGILRAMEQDFMTEPQEDS
jgi:hypothetical protein